MFPVLKRMSGASLAVAVICTMAACASGPPKSDAEQQADRETAERVEAALNADKSLYARHITVRADNGVVRLGGYVWTQPELDEAERIAEQVSGVTKVVDDLELQRNGIDNSQVSR